MPLSQNSRDLFIFFAGTENSYIDMLMYLQLKLPQVGEIDPIMMEGIRIYGAGTSPMPSSGSSSSSMAAALALPPSPPPSPRASAAAVHFPPSPRASIGAGAGAGAPSSPFHPSQRASVGAGAGAGAGDQPAPLGIPRTNLRSRIDNNLTKGIITQSSAQHTFLYWCFDGVSSRKAQVEQGEAQDPRRVTRRAAVASRLTENLGRTPVETPGGALPEWVTGEGIVQNALDALRVIHTVKNVLTEYTLTINLVGFSRGGASAVILANFISQYFQNTMLVDLFLIDPVPGNFAIYSNFISSQPLNTEFDAHRQGLRDETLMISTQIIPKNVKRAVVIMALEERRIGFEPLDFHTLKVQSYKTCFTFLPVSKDHAYANIWASPILKSFFPILLPCHIDYSLKDSNREVGKYYEELNYSSNISRKQPPNQPGFGKSGLYFLNHYLRLYKKMPFVPPNFFSIREANENEQSAFYLEFLKEFYREEEGFFNDPSRNYKIFKGPGLPFESPLQGITGIKGVFQRTLMTLSTRQVYKDFIKYTPSTELFLNIFHAFLFSKLFPNLYVHIFSGSKNMTETTQARSDFSKIYTLPNISVIAERLKNLVIKKRRPASDEQIFQSLNGILSTEQSVAPYATYLSVYFDQIEKFFFPTPAELVEWFLLGQPLQPGKFLSKILYQTLIDEMTRLNSLSSVNLKEDINRKEFKMHQLGILIRHLGDAISKLDVRARLLGKLAAEMRSAVRPSVAAPPAATATAAAAAAAAVPAAHFMDEPITEDNLREAKNRLEATLRMDDLELLKKMLPDLAMVAKIRTVNVPPPPRLSFPISNQYLATEKQNLPPKQVPQGPTTETLQLLIDFANRCDLTAEECVNVGLNDGLTKIVTDAPQYPEKTIAENILALHKWRMGLRG